MRLPPTPRLLVVALVLGLLASCSGGSDDKAAQTTAGPDYVAIGDSIAAGGGAPPYDESSGYCYRSPVGYPVLVDAEQPDIELTAFVACGGATVANLVGPWTERGLPPQAPNEQNPDVGLVTLNIGANDLGYGAFLVTCLIGDCSPITPDGEKAYTGKLESLRSSLVNDLYPALRIAYPNARILHVGYPRLVTTRPTPLCEWLAAPEQTRIEQVLVELNETIEDAVAERGDDQLSYVDITEATDHHEMCTIDPWVVKLDEPDASGGHPDAHGYEAIASVIEAKL